MRYKDLHESFDLLDHPANAMTHELLTSHMNDRTHGNIVPFAQGYRRYYSNAEGVHDPEELHAGLAGLGWKKHEGISTRDEPFYSHPETNTTLGFEDGGRRAHLIQPLDSNGVLKPFNK